MQRICNESADPLTGLTVIGMPVVDKLSHLFAREE
jgi:hypothetical protein